MCELKNCFYLISYYDHFDKLLRLENVKLFSRQDSINSCDDNLDIVSKIV